MAMQYVVYSGKVHFRAITEQDWKTVGISDGMMLVWSASNGFAVPLNMLTDKQIERAIIPDPDFRITGEDEDYQPTLRPGQNMTPSELRQSIENPVDVIALLNGADQPSATGSGATPPVMQDDSTTADDTRPMAEARQMVSGSHMDDDAS